MTKAIPAIGRCDNTVCPSKQPVPDLFDEPAEEVLLASGRHACVWCGEPGEALR